jgi:hypothetical protein
MSTMWQRDRSKWPAADSNMPRAVKHRSFYLLFQSVHPFALLFFCSCQAANSNLVVQEGAYIVYSGTIYRHDTAVFMDKESRFYSIRNNNVISQKQFADVMKAFDPYETACLRVEFSAFSGGVEIDPLSGAPGRNLLLVEQYDRIEPIECDKDPFSKLPYVPSDN